MSLESCKEMNEWVTPECLLFNMSECHIVGNKLKSCLIDESQKTRWEEFRRLAKSDIAKEECSQLLRRMELQDSDEEEDETMEDLMSEDTVKIEAETYEETHGRKMQKRQIQWGPVQRVARLRRYPKDGKTMMLRAQELKEYKNLCKGAYLDRGKDGAIMDSKDAKKMETTVRAGPGNHGGLGDTSSREQSKPATENLLGWRNEIKVGSIGFTTFGTGLRRYDSV